MKGIVTCKCKEKVLSNYFCPWIIYPSAAHTKDRCGHFTLIEMEVTYPMKKAALRITWVTGTFTLHHGSEFK